MHGLAGDHRDRLRLACRGEAGVEAREPVLDAGAGSTLEDLAAAAASGAGIGVLPQSITGYVKLVG